MYEPKFAIRTPFGASTAAFLVSSPVWPVESQLPKMKAGINRTKMNGLK